MKKPFSNILHSAVLALCIPKALVLVPRTCYNLKLPEVTRIIIDNDDSYLFTNVNKVAREHFFFFIYP